MTDRRTPPRFLRRGLLAAAAVCALGGPAVADPAPAREYPPTYSSRKAPWYDPFGLFTEVPKPAPTGGSAPVPNERLEAPAGGGPTPAWKWYGYGTPTPGRNPLAPNGSYPAVPGNWYTSTGTTPGAIPMARLGVGPLLDPAAPNLVPDPAPGRAPEAVLPPPRTEVADRVIAPTADPKLPAVPMPPPVVPSTDPDWKAPAALRAPTPDGPGATLRAPVRVDVPPPCPPIPPARPDPPAAESPDLPVSPAPGIVMPPVSRAAVPTTYRGQAPEADLAAVIRKAAGHGVRVMEVSPAGPKRVIVRLAGSADAARAARDRLARVPELAGWRVEFELVTALK